jgi:hypothetical protein
MARYPVENPILASTALTASGASSAFKLDEPSEYVSVLVSTSAVSGTTPSVTFTVEWSNDGTTFAQGDTADTFTAITTAVNHVKDFAIKGRYMRLVWTITGTTPSFTTVATATVRGSRAFE